MSALVKLPTATRIANYIRVQLTDGMKTRATKTTLGLEVYGEPLVHVYGGERDGDSIPNGVVKPNQKVTINLGIANPHKYQVIFESHPDLIYHGIVQHPRFIEPGDMLALNILFKADKQINVHELPWIGRLYMID